MEQCERYFCTCDFYFIADNTTSALDGFYDLEDLEIKKLMGVMYSRGHSIGLHGSYNSYNSDAQAKKEQKKLVNILDSLKIDVSSIGLRQHYLRWDILTTPRVWQDANCSFDSTLGFADQAGFRSGVCFEYPLYDLRDRTTLSIREKPLVLMERTVIDDCYMGLGYGDQASNYMIKLKNRCRQFNGEFVFLWHNSHLQSAEDRALFESLLRD